MEFCSRLRRSLLGAFGAEPETPRTLLELCNSTAFCIRSLGVAAASRPDVV